MEHQIGQLIAADEQFCHQVTDTFADVGTSDPSWTEKVCAMAAAKDGSLQLGFGLGKYTNRNVMDAYAGISRGVEQITVRASRRLAPEPERTVIGPIRYEIVEPLQTIRFVLEPNDVQPIAFDWLFEGAVPARDRGPHPHPQRLPGVRRPRALPPDRRVLRVGRDRRRAAPRWTPTPGSRPATTRGACATASARPTDVEPRELERARARTTSSGPRCSWSVPTAPATASSSTSGSPQARATSTRR